MRMAALGAALLSYGVTASPSMAAPPEAAQEIDVARMMRLGDVESGTLLFRSDNHGQYTPALTLSTDIKIDVTGPILRATVTQKFRNDSKEWVEGVYAFPLPTDSAVDGLKLRIGDRFIEGQIKEREEARKTYERAKAEGRKASLVEQQRPNLFTNEVANIGPGHIIIAQIEFQQALMPKDGAYRLRMPLVVAPRYNPRPVVQMVNFGEGGWAINDPVPDREKIESPVLDPREIEGIHNPVTLQVSLDAGFPLAKVSSPHHPVKIEREDDTATIRLDGPVPANRDFELIWTAKPLTEPTAALFQEKVDGEDYLLAFVTPPQIGEMAEKPQPREVIFVQDVSGSMGGTSIRQAREALEMAVTRLRPEDRFNIITFSNDFKMFHRAPVEATPGAIASAVRRIRQLEAGGGTNMAPALSMALEDGTQDRSKLRQVIFLTDGAVGNETLLFTLIDKALGRSRLFTVGIGSAPNSYFMTRAAEMGRGAQVTISDLSQVREQMAALFAKIETPAMTDLSAKFPNGMSAEFWPNPLPDVYAGEPVALAIKSAAATGIVKLSGDRGDEQWSVDLPLDKAATREGIGKLWARSKIRALEGQRNKAGTSPDQRDQANEDILQTALTHGLVSRRTSLVAVDVEVSRPEGVELASVEVPLNLPAGWDPALFFDEQDQQRQRETPGVRDASLDTQRDDVQGAAARALQFAPVPRGSLNWESGLLRGLLLMLLSALTLIVARRAF